jgi:hypothetical protein
MMKKHGAKSIEQRARRNAQKDSGQLPVISDQQNRKPTEERTNNGVLE